MTDMQQTQPSISDVQELLQNAQASHIQKGLSQAATEILVQNLAPAMLAGTLGVGYEALSSDKAFLFVPLLDMTGSMWQSRQDVIDAYNTMLGILKNSKQTDQMLMSSWTFNTQSYLLHGYTPLEFVPSLDTSMYSPDNQTALYDAILDALTGVVTYGQELRDQGVRTKITFVVFTDGNDNASKNSAAKVRKVVQELLAQEIYTFALVGFGSGFAQKTGQSLGFTNVLEAGADPASIRDALEIVSRSVIQASQSMIADQAANSFFK